MASPAPSPHPLARQLVCICVEQYRLRPGRSIPASRIWGALGAVEPEHFKDGMTDAIARAWLQEHGSEVQLTEAGYTAATGTRPPIVVDDAKQILNVAVHQLRVRVGDPVPLHTLLLVLHPLTSAEIHAAAQEAVSRGWLSKDVPGELTLTAAGHELV